MANASDISASSDEIDLHMSFEESSFEDFSTEDARDIAPYRFEPAATDSDDSDESNGENEPEPEHRLGNTEWCHCGFCINMPTLKESVCCTEVPRVDEKRGSFTKELACITEHPGFSSVCLDVYVLETAYYQYRSQYGEMRATTEERNRYTAYRQFVRWCWGYLGHKIRVPLPSCVVAKIRNSFASEEYQGFKAP